MSINTQQLITFIAVYVFTYLCWLVSTSIGDPPRPGPMDASLESTLIKKGLTTFSKFKLKGTIGVEHASWHIDR